MSESDPSGFSVPVPYAPPPGPRPKEPVGFVSAEALSEYERACAKWRERAERRLTFMSARGTLAAALHDVGRAFGWLSSGRKAA